MAADGDTHNVDAAKEYLSQALNLIEAATERMEWECERGNLNDDVVYQMKESATGLGFALATLCRWNDEILNTED